jgi:K+-transporting ATPase KdpF subunit
LDHSWRSARSSAFLKTSYGPRLHCRTIIPPPSTTVLDRRKGDDSMASYVLLAIVIGLVIYLFYAVINPEKF